MRFFRQQNSNTQQIYTLFSIVKCNSTMIKHRFYNAVDFSVRHSTLSLNKTFSSMLPKTSSETSHSNAPKSHSDYVFSTIAAPSLLRASKMSCDEFVLFGTPKHPQLILKLKRSNLNIQNSVLPFIYMFVN